MARPGHRSALSSDISSIQSPSDSISDVSSNTHHDKPTFSKELDTCESDIQQSNLGRQHCSGNEQFSPSDVLRVLATPPRYPRRSLQVNTTSPPRPQRMSDYEPFTQEHKTTSILHRHSVAGMNIHTDYNQSFLQQSNKEQTWISLPMFPKESNSRQRKLSVFHYNQVDEQEQSNLENLKDTFKETRESIQHKRTTK